MTTFTPQQTTFIETLAEGTSNLRLDSVAGSGKTTTMKGAVNALPASAKVFTGAFSKRIQQDLEKAITPSAARVVQTFNGCGHRAFAAALGKKLRLEADKNTILAQELLDEKKFVKQDLFGVPAILRRIKTHGLKPADLTPEYIEDQALELELFSTPPIEKVRLLLEKSIETAYSGFIDFDDQLYMSTRFMGVFEKFDFVLIDEAQDTSPIQTDMIRKLGRANARFAFIGDPHQAIYGFRGASSDSMNELAQGFSTTQLALSVSFRCARSIVRMAQAYVPHMSSADGAPEGRIENLSKWNISTLQPGNVVLCRNNGPLLRVAFRLAARGIPVNIVGREFGRGLINTLDKHRGAGATSREVFGACENELNAAIAAAMTKGRKGRAEYLSEKLDAIAGLFEMAPPMWTDWKAALAALFSAPAGTGITFSSIHRAKGLEWQNVKILDWNLIPSKKAKTDEDLRQEDNLAYVALTRVKGDGTLTFIQSSGFGA